MKTINNYKFRLFLIRFFIIGMMAYIVEALFTSIMSLGGSIYSLLTIGNYKFDIIKAVTGYVGLFAFFVYCWAAIPFTFLTNPLKKVFKNDLLIPKLGILLRGLIYGLIFMGIEFIIGLILLIFNFRAWDYSHLPLNVCGIITFLFLPAWTFAGIVGEWVHDRLLQIDDILLNSKGFDDKGIKKGYENYEQYQKQKTKRKSEK